MTHPNNEDVVRWTEACYRVEATMPGLKQSIKEWLEVLAQTERDTTERKRHATY